jgi:branched-chain amino acid aminotransferase
VIQICRELGITIKERSIQRAALYIADELFFSGTAAEITPIRSVDRITIGNGTRGDITTKIQKVFFEITSGERPAPGPWLTYVNQQKTAGNADENGRPANAKGTGGSGVTTVEPELVARAHALAAD